MATSAKAMGRSRDQVVANRLFERRNALDMKLRDVAGALTALGLPTTVQQVSQMEKGMTIDVARVICLAAVLSCTVTYLQGGTDSPTKWTPDVPLREWATRVYLNGLSPLRAIEGQGQGVPTGQTILLRSVKTLGRSAVVSKNRSTADSSSDAPSPARRTAGTR